MSKFKVGDRVYDWMRGLNGVVIDDKSYYVVVKFREGVHSYNSNGGYQSSDKYPVLMLEHEEPPVIKKPMPKLEKGDIVEVTTPEGGRCLRWATGEYRDGRPYLTSYFDNHNVFVPQLPHLESTFKLIKKANDND